LKIGTYKRKVTASPFKYQLVDAVGKMINIYRGADKSLARPGRKKATATEDFEFHISYL